MPASRGFLAFIDTIERIPPARRLIYLWDRQAELSAGPELALYRELYTQTIKAIPAPWRLAS